MWTGSRGVCAWLVVVTVVCLLEEVSGWASFKHLSREKRAWLEIIAVKQGLHVESHIKEMRGLSRVKRQSDSCSGYGGGGGGGGGSRPGGSSIGGSRGGGGGGRNRGGGGNVPVFVFDTIVVTARRPRPSPTLNVQFPIRFPSGGGGGGRGGAPAPPPPPTPPPPTPATPPPEPPEDKDAKKMTYDQFIHQLEKLESLLPDLPPDQMAHKLRMLVARYDSTVWKQMLNVNNPIPLVGRDVEGFKAAPAQKGTFNQLREMMDHRFKSGTELGVIKVNGETVALGHVITGATAGYDNQKFLGMDNLFSTTISGDLGQSGLKNSKDPTSPVIGPAGTWKNGKYELPSKGGMATRAEILGDIDGFNIGKRIMADSTKPLSQHLREYYTRESSRRFDIFKGHTTKAALKAEVYKFANLYDYKEAGLLASVLRNSSPELAVRRATEIDRIATSAVNSFCTAFSSELGTWCK